MLYLRCSHKPSEICDRRKLHVGAGPSEAPVRAAFSMSTAYHAKYFANELTLRRPAGLDRLSASLFNATVDLNPTR